MEQFCDLHIHTTHSDGERTVKGLLEFATSKNLYKLSITDHDCVDAYLELENEDLRKTYSGQILIGCEFACVCNGNPIEILGYGFDYRKIKPYLDEFGFPQSIMDKIHCQNFINVAKTLGVDVNFDYNVNFPNSKKNMKFENLYHSLLKNEKFYNGLYEENPDFVTRPSKLMRFGINNPNSIFYQDTAHNFPTAEKIIDLIHLYGGLCFLAHPYQYGDNMHKILEKLKDKLDGIECYHYTSEEPEKQAFLKQYSAKHNLLKSGGSDYHYIYDKNHSKDRLNEFKVPQEYFDLIVKNMPTKKPLI